jgi:endonuclease YncB( thermonuclease family)
VSEPFRYGSRPKEGPRTVAARALYVRDGDTVEMESAPQISFEDRDTTVYVVRRYVVRLLKVDCPEKKQATMEAWRAARVFADNRLAPGGARLWCDLWLSGRRDRYDRELGLIDVGGVDLSDLLIEAGLGDARDYGSHLAALAAD